MDILFTKFTLDKVRTTSKQMSPGRLAVDCETVETYKQDPDGSKESAKRRVGSAFQTGTIFHYVVKKKKKKHSASQRFTVNVKDYITTCCGPKALVEGELKPAHIQYVYKPSR